MINLDEIFQREFDKLINLEGIKKQFISDNESSIRAIFGYIFSINNLKNKVETRRYFSSEFNMTFSLLLESIYALLTGQCRSALLLLRSAQEANFKFVLERERELLKSNNSSISFEPLDYRFVETKKKFIHDLQNTLDKNDFKEYYISIERNLTLYKRLSGVVHSGSNKLPIMSVEYFSNLHEETILDKDDYFELFCKVLNDIFLLDYFLIRESLNKWDYYALYKFLRILYGDKRSKTLIRIVKDAQ